MASASLKCWWPWRCFPSACSTRRTPDHRTQVQPSILRTHAGGIASLRHHRPHARQQKRQRAAPSTRLTATSHSVRHWGRQSPIAHQHNPHRVPSLPSTTSASGTTLMPACSRRARVQSGAREVSPTIITAIPCELRTIRLDIPRCRRMEGNDIYMRLDVGRPSHEDRRWLESPQSPFHGWHGTDIASPG